MTYRVEVEPSALSAATRYLKDDPAAVAVLLEAIDGLESNPRPLESRPWGPDYRRAHFGTWRVLYFIDDAEKLIRVANIGKSGVAP